MHNQSKEQQSIEMNHNWMKGCPKNGAVCQPNQFNINLKAQSGSYRSTILVEAAWVSDVSSEVVNVNVGIPTRKKHVHFSGIKHAKPCRI